MQPERNKELADVDIKLTPKKDIHKVIFRLFLFLQSFFPIIRLLIFFFLFFASIFISCLQLWTVKIDIMSTSEAYADILPYLRYKTVNELYIKVITSSLI